MRQNEPGRPARVIARGVEATVKWFNRSKGFGFVQLADGSQDAFLHISVVDRTGQDVSDGSKLVCDLSEGPRGPQVAEIHRIEAGPPMERPAGGGFGAERGFGGGGGERSGGGYAAPRGGFSRERGGMGGGGGGGGMSAGGAAASGPAMTIEGKVKFFNTEKGFGFVTPDDGSKDVFVHVRALQRSGLAGLEPEQRVRMRARMGQKGPMAESVELI